MRLAVVLLLFVSSSALAAGRICISRDTLLFGNQATATAVTQSSLVSNCGDAALSFTDVSVHPATAAAYRVASSCTTGRSLAPSESCSVDVTFAPTSPGQVSGGLWLHNTTSTPDQIVTFYGRGVDAQAGTATLQFTPGSLDFGAQSVGATSTAQTLTLHNAGPGTLTLRALVINGPAAYDFRAPGNCLLGFAIPAGGSCDLYFNFTPAAAGVRAAQLNVDAPELANLAVVAVRGVGIQTLPPVPAAQAIDVIEFYNAPLNHYFLTAVPEEAAMLDQGRLGPDWQRTGLTFRAYPVASTAGVDVCRFFGTATGPSAHFYTADPAECTAVKANPRWAYEGTAFRALLPTVGTCALGTQPVIRFFWPGADVSQSRHRYVLDPAALAAMRAQAWIEEGAVFCSPH
jgi:hypothetical protein